MDDVYNEFYSGQVSAMEVDHLITELRQGINNGNYESVFREIAASRSDHPELVALKVLALLGMNRSDLAQEVVGKIQNDLVLTQLMEAWVYLSMGDVENVQQSYYIFHELASIGPCALLMVGQAASKMASGRFEEAERLLSHVLHNTSHADALANMVSVCIALQKPYATYLDLLRKTYPCHVLIKNLEQKEELFDIAAYKFM